MNNRIKSHFNNVLHHLYVNPLEKCNLQCRICYTRKTSPILTEIQIMDFITRYHKEYEIQIITFCGGEVLSLSYFPHLVNNPTAQGIFVQIITNGTINRLNEFDRPNSINVIVSIDGLKQYHDSNRGIGNFDKSIKFLKEAKDKGFHTEIFSILTHQNLKNIEKFESFLDKTFKSINITYHPRKPMSYLSKHPISNLVGHGADFDFLTNEEMIKVMKTKNIFPPKGLGCYQISVASDGKVYGCCEGFLALGTIKDPILQLTDTLEQNIDGPCLGCSQPDFMCGIKHIYNTLYA